MISAVLDTNVLVSALIVTRGKPAQIVDYIQARKFQLILSDDILIEAREVLQRKHIQRRFQPSPADIDEYLGRLRGISQMVAVREIENVIVNDPPDNLILACAREGSADYLVSGNDHLLALREHHHTQVVSPARFLTLLDSLPDPERSITA